MKGEQSWQVEVFWEGASPISSVVGRSVTTASRALAKLKIVVFWARSLATEVHREFTWARTVQ